MPDKQQTLCKAIPISETYTVSDKPRALFSPRVWMLEGPLRAQSLPAIDGRTPRFSRHTA